MFPSYISLPDVICCKNTVQEKCVGATSHDIFEVGALNPHPFLIVGILLPYVFAII